MKYGHVIHIKDRCGGMFFGGGGWGGLNYLRVEWDPYIEDKAISYCSADFQAKTLQTFPSFLTEGGQTTFKVFIVNIIFPETTCINKSQ